MIQQSINQMLGSLGAIASVGKHFKDEDIKQQKAEFKAAKDAQAEATRNKQFNALKRQNTKYIKQVSSLEKRIQAMEQMQQKAETQIQQDNDFKETRSIILGPTGQPIIKEK